MTIHDTINSLCRQARKLAPKVAEQAGNSGCTMETLPTGPRQRRAYLLEALALSLNVVSQDDGSEPNLTDEEALGMYVPAEMLTDNVRAEYAALRDPYRNPGFPAPTTREGQDEQDRLANEAADAFFDTLRAENTSEPAKQDTPTVRIIPSSRLFGMAGSHVVMIDTTHGYRDDRPIGIHFYSDRTRTTLCVTRRPVDSLFGNWTRDERAIRV